MLLRRLGNKSKIVNTTSILNYFPPHDIFIDMFFGAGGVFFNKPLANYNICNDLDSDVFNLFTVVTHQRKALMKLRAKESALHAVFFIITELQSYRDLDSVIFIEGQLTSPIERILFYRKVQKNILAL